MTVSQVNINEYPTNVIFNKKLQLHQPQNAT